MSFINATEMPARLFLSSESMLLKVLYFTCDLTLSFYFCSPWSPFDKKKDNNPADLIKFYFR